MEIVHTLDEQCWREFVDRHPQGNVFHTPEMYAVYARARGYRPLLWAVVEGDQVLALHVPVRVRLAGGPLAVFTTRSIAFGSLLAEQSARGRAALDMLLNAYNRHTSGWPLFTELRNFSDYRAINDILEKHGYAYQEHENFVVDVTRDPYDMLQDFDRRLRQHLRRTERDGNVEVREVTSPAMLPLFYQMLQKTYRFARVPLADISLFEAAFELLVPKNMARFTMAYVQGVPASSVVVLLHKGVMYGWYNGTDRSIREARPNEYLVWDTIRWGAANGQRLLDFGGAGKPGEKYGVRDFKAKFNGQLVSYGRNICVHSPLRMRLSETAYGLARKMALLRM